MEIATCLKKIFYEQKLDNVTARSVAEDLGISNKTLSNYINGDRYIPLKHLNSLCNLFDMSADYILGLTDLKNYKNYQKINELNNNLIAKRLKSIRKTLGLTQEEFATKLQITKSSICKYERGYSTILTIILYTICKKYGISADYLLGRIDEPIYHTIK